jgi:hypothetical protein
MLLAEPPGNRLAEAEERSLEAHIFECAACLQEVETLGVLWKSLSLLPAEEPSSAMRLRFYESLSAYRQGAESQPVKGRWWPLAPVWQLASAAAVLVIGVGIGYAIKPGPPRQEIAELHQEVREMRQLVALSLLQQQGSATDRLRGVSWAYRAEPSDTEVLSALISTINHDPNVNVRLAAVDALHAFAASPMTRQAVLDSLPMQDTPLMQVALIDLAVDLKERRASQELTRLVADTSIDVGVKQRAQWALEKLQ